MKRLQSCLKIRLDWENSSHRGVLQQMGANCIFCQERLRTTNNAIVCKACDYDILFCCGSKPMIYDMCCDNIRVWSVRISHQGKFQTRLRIQYRHNKQDVLLAEMEPVQDLQTLLNKVRVLQATHKAQEELSLQGARHEVWDEEYYYEE